MNDDFKNITMIGKICYLFMCMERYLLALYPDHDLRPVARKMWQWSSHWWDEAWDNYSTVVPEYLMEFGTYEETNERSFDGELSKSDYDEIIALYNGITNGKGENEFDQVMRLPIDFGNATEGTSVKDAEAEVVECLVIMENILKKHDILLPDKSILCHFEYDREKPYVEGEKEPGWGDFENTEYLSIILNKS